MARSCPRLPSAHRTEHNTLHSRRLAIALPAPISTRRRAASCRALGAEPAAGAGSAKPSAVTPLSATGPTPTPAPCSPSAASTRGAGVATNSTAVEVLFPAEDFAAAPLIRLPIPIEQQLHQFDHTLWNDVDDWPRSGADAQSILTSAFGGLAAGVGSDVSLPALSSSAASAAQVEHLPAAEPADSLLDTLLSTLTLAFHAYGNALEDRPIITKAATAFITFLVGDVIAQQSQHVVVLDILRVLRQGSYGLMDGPIGHFWYNVLDKHIFPKEPTAMKSVIAKTAADQLVWSPIMTCVFFAYLSILQGCPAEVLPTIQHKLLPTLAANYAYWPLVHLVNFRYVPNKYRIPYNSLLCIVWTTYLSLSSHNGGCGVHG